MKYLMVLLLACAAWSQNAVATLGSPMDVHALVPVVITPVSETSMTMTLPFAEPGPINVWGVYASGTRTLIEAHVVTVGREPLILLRSDWLAGFDWFEITDGSGKQLATVGDAPAAAGDAEKGTSTIKCTDGPCVILKEWIDKDGQLQSKETTVKDGAIIVIPASSAIVVTCLNGCSPQ